MALPPPITNTEVYLAAVLEVLTQIKDGLIDVETELQQLNNAATQKPTIQLDVVKLADNITTAIQQQSKAVKSKGV
jgi:hypothetical protein